MFMYSDYSQHLLDNVKKIHFIGCGGSGMYPLIQILAAKGYELSGSDVLDGSIIRYEREMGVKVSLGHSADNIIGVDMVVYSAAISKDNVELCAASSYGIPTIERSVLLGYVSRLYKQSICVSGTHGKTTTTSMITTALELAGRDPSAVIGGKLPLINGYGKAGKGDDVVIEACEFAETFLKLTPYLSVVLNIDNDHLDYYGSMGELKFAFKRFALMTQFMIFANADDKNTMDVMYTLDRRVRTFAIDNHADYRAININEYKPGFFEFDLKEWNTTDTTRIRLSVPGRHNIYNALAMCAVCRFVGLSAEQCAEAALNFKGAGRCLTDDDGNYSFLSIKPGAYPAFYAPGYQAWRAAHVHFSIFGPGFDSRLVTQMYFEGDPLLAQDRFVVGIPDARGRDALVAKLDAARSVSNSFGPPRLVATPDGAGALIQPPKRSDPGALRNNPSALAYRFDIVLRGRGATPFEDRA